MRSFILGTISALMCACANDFNPQIVQDDAGDDTPIVMPGATTDDADESSGEDTAGTSGASTDGDDESEGSSDDGSESSDSGETEEPPIHPGPGEPCDPFLAFEGIAPCEDPGQPSLPFTCVPVSLMPNPGETVWEFRCTQVQDSQGNGEDLGDPCSDNGGTEFLGCMNSYCLSNGLGLDPVNDPYMNHPPVPEDDACPFIWWSEDDPNHEGEGYYVKACCSSFCDAAHPCDAGWTCQTNSAVPAALNGEEVGVCVWA